MIPVEKQAEQLFVRRYDEVKQGLHARDSYEMLKLAAALRQLLVDGQPLVHLASKNRRIRVLFTVNELENIKDIPVAPAFVFHGSGLDPNNNSTNLGQKQLKLDQFLSLPVFESLEWTVTVRELIKYVSNKLGGVHFDLSRTDKETEIEKCQQMIALVGVDSISLSLNVIARITLVALTPLREEIGYRQGQFLGGDINHELKQGWGWHGVLKVLSQEHSEQVLYEIGNIDGSPPRITLLIDASGDLVGRIQINEGMRSEVHARGFCDTDYFDSFIYVSLEIKYEENIEIVLFINNTLTAIERVTTKNTPKKVTLHTIGTDLKGDNSANFYIAEFFAVDDILDDQTRESLAGYFNQKYGLTI